MPFCAVSETPGKLVPGDFGHKKRKPDLVAMVLQQTVQKLQNREFSSPVGRARQHGGKVNPYADGPELTGGWVWSVGRSFQEPYDLTNGQSYQLVNLGLPPISCSCDHADLKPPNAPAFAARSPLPFALRFLRLLIT